MGKFNIYVTAALVVFIFCLTIPIHCDAGRYVCLDKDDKIIPCPIEDAEKQTIRRSTPAQADLSHQPAGMPYQHHKRNKQPDKK